MLTSCIDMSVSCKDRKTLLGTVNTLARAIACDTPATLNSCSHCTIYYRQCRHGNSARQCQLGSFSRCRFGWRLGAPLSWACRKQTAVSHSCTDSQLISLDTGLRMEGLLALTLGDLVIDVLEPLVSGKQGGNFWLSRRKRTQNARKTSQTSNPRSSNVETAAKKSSHPLISYHLSRHMPAKEQTCSFSKTTTRL